MARKSKHSKKTTIAISKSTVERINARSKRGESYDQVLDRLLSGTGDVWIEVLQVDGDSPAKHKVLFKLGECIYLWDGERFVPVDPKKVKAVVEGMPIG